MSHRVTAGALSAQELEVWSEVRAKRKVEWSALKNGQVEEIVEEWWRGESSPPQIDDAFAKLEWLLDEHLNRSADDKLTPSKRRSSFHVLTKLLKRIDEEYEKVVSNTKKTCSNKETCIASNTHQSSQKRQKETRKRSAGPSKSGASSTSTSLSSAAAPGNDTRAPLPSSSEHRVASEEATTRTGTASSAGASVARSTSQAHQSALTPASQSAPASTTQTSTLAPAPPASRPPASSPAASTLQRSVSRVSGTESHPTYSAASASPAGAMGISASKSARVAPTTATVPASFSASENTPPSEAPSSKAPLYKVKQPFLPQQTQPESIWFAQDTDGTLSSSLLGRSSVRVRYRRRIPSPDLLKHTLARLAMWDPYWKVQHVLSFEVTSKIERVENLTKGPPPSRAAACKVMVPPAWVDQITDWGRPAAAKQPMIASHGDTRLLLRMLPLAPPAENTTTTTTKMGKKPRADTHLWAKGTFVQINGRPIRIEQRKQQSHDPKEWKYMSRPLDVTPHILNPASLNPIQICTMDEDPYIVCLAICQYQSAENVYNRILNEVERLSHEAAFAKAVERANHHTFVLDDADDENDEDAANSFIFPLSCPVSRQILKTPVRSKRCLHWNCFDLKNFLESNQAVSGTRWECPVCGCLTSCYDLQLCGLTRSLLEEFKEEVRPHRDRIQFFSDGTYKLLGEEKRRYSKKRSMDDDDGGGNGKRQRREEPVAKVPEIIELL